MPSRTRFDQLAAALAATKALAYPGTTIDSGKASTFTSALCPQV
jgi:hypothetical protein